MGGSFGQGLLKRLAVAGRGFASLSAALLPLERVTGWVHAALGLKHELRRTRIRRGHCGLVLLRVGLGAAARVARGGILAAQAFNLGAVIRDMREQRDLPGARGLDGCARGGQGDNVNLHRRHLR